MLVVDWGAPKVKYVAKLWSLGKEGEIVKLLMIVTPREAICFSSLIWLARNKSVQKSRFSRIVENSREISLLDLDLEAF